MNAQSNTVLKFWQRFTGQWVWTGLSLLLTISAALAIVVGYFLAQVPNIDVLTHLDMKVPLRIYSAEGQLVAQYGTERRIPLAYAQFPPLLVQAVLATEDQRFFDHPGIDPIGLLRAAIAVTTSGHKVQGASTITMQVARNFFLSDEKTFSRKIKEILLAIKIDNALPKQTILELYLNKIYLGKRAYGMAAAAEVYFGKSLGLLNLSELALLAGLPQAPSRDNPINNPEGALKRRNHVLDRMLDAGFISQTAHHSAIQTPLTAHYHNPTAQLNASYVAEMVRQQLLAEYGDKIYGMGMHVFTTIHTNLQLAASKALTQGVSDYDKRHGYRKSMINLGKPHHLEDTLPWQEALLSLRESLKNTDAEIAAALSVYDRSITALRDDGSTVQIPWEGLEWAKSFQEDGKPLIAVKKASEIVKPGDVIFIRPIATADNTTHPTWALTQSPIVEGALVALDPHDGAILALVGGGKPESNGFNRVTQARRQPGSAFKPFIFSAALDKGYTLASRINDMPIAIMDRGSSTIWRPGNDENEFNGPTSLRDALTYSKNLVSVRLLQSIGVTYALNYLKRFGFESSHQPHNLSLALGTGSVTPLQLAAGYAVFANGGYQVKPYLIQRIADNSGATIFQATPPTAYVPDTSVPTSDLEKPMANIPKNLAPQTISPQTAYLISEALQSVIRRGTGSAAKTLNRTDLAGKTGTTNDKIDAWFAGFNGDIVSAVWMGYDNYKPIYEYGREAALPIWMDFMQEALGDKPAHPVAQPAGIMTVRINAGSGLAARPGETNTYYEYFRTNNVKKFLATERKEPESNAAYTGTNHSASTTVTYHAPAAAAPSRPGPTVADVFD